ncbi:MAG: adenylosuccinate synthase [Candidatus Helarchaeota archaeon]|nr:adenylosuccinate synthase [Candidatus Helarchaeota archaeon]
MPAVVIIGSQWGDEGKGKITDFYSDKADIVVRFQGGNNAGHTVVIGDETYKFHLIPSGTIQNKQVIIGNGCVIDPRVLLQEVELLKSKGFKIDLKISSNAHVIFPYHNLLDGLEEKFKGKLSAGTTKRGIGPCYQDKVARFGIKIFDLLHENILRMKLDQNITLKQKLLEIYEDDTKLDEEIIIDEYIKYGEKIRSFVDETPYIINKALDENKKVLFEGAQGALLSIDHGIYPRTTSSNTCSGGACVGAGVGPTRINKVIGVMKAYLSRVGTGPVPTEITTEEEEIANYIREKGHEYGTTTGRPRRIGWLDLVAVKYAKMINNIDALAVTKLDTLGGLQKIKICVAYKIGDEKKESDIMPTNMLENCKPVYIEMQGWEDKSPNEWNKIAKKGYNAIPENMKAYLKKIQDYLKIPFCLISIGPRRSDSIQLQKIFEEV